MDENEEINYNKTGDNRIKKIFKIPIGHKSRKEANAIIDNLKKEFDRDKNDIVLEDGTVFADWNKFSMDELADYLERKYMLSSGEALAIHKLVQFYREHKDDNK